MLLLAKSHVPYRNSGIPDKATWARHLLCLYHERVPVHIALLPAGYVGIPSPKKTTNLTNGGKARTPTRRNPTAFLELQ
eukprot:3934105-Rhodomonas_salina.1